MNEFKQGTIIVFEGLDCSFKETNSKALYEHCKSFTNKVKLFSFPNYESESSYFVKEYLQGKYGENPADVDPYKAVLFYALDKFDTYMKEIKQYYEQGYLIILDRYVSSNVYYQLAKFNNNHTWKKTERDFIEYVQEIEFSILGLPYPNFNIFMSTPIDVARKLMAEKKGKDIHETATDYQKNVYELYDRLFCKNLRTDDGMTSYRRLTAAVIDNVEDGEILSKEAIFNKVLSAVEPTLNKFKESEGIK